jgi:23S rRNA pseudouridine2605 synthase
VHGEVPDEVLERLKSGIELEDGTARFEELAIISRGDSHSWFRVVIREGRNREVRRMWESQGLMVSRLKRIRYGNVELPRGLLKGQSETLDPQQVKSLRDLVGATDPEPTLTLQPVVNQRRAAKPSNEFRPAPRTQQAWTGAADEGRELRAFDRIREDTPFRPGGKRKPGSGKRPPRGGNGPSGRGRDQQPRGQQPRDRRPPGARPPRRGAVRGNAPGQGQSQFGGPQIGGPQIGVYQPRPWSPGDDAGRTGPRPPRRGKPRPGGPGGGGGFRGANTQGDPRRQGRPGNPNAGWRPPVTGAYGERNESRSPRRGNPGYAAQGQQQRPRRPNEGLPRDDIGNRLPTQNNGPRRPGKRRPPPRQ